MVSFGTFTRNWEYLMKGVAFVCHHNTFLIYGSIRHPSLKAFAKVAHLSLLSSLLDQRVISNDSTSLLASLTLGAGGYWIFTDKTQGTVSSGHHSMIHLGNVLSNFPHDNSVINLARLCFACNMVFTFPLECFVCREVLILSMGYLME